MFSLRSARARAVLAGLVLIVLLAGIATLALWRTRDMQQRHHALEHTSAVATALEHAQAQFWEAQATLSALVFFDDPTLVNDYHDVVTALEQNLSQARAWALAAGEADEVAALDDLTERIGQFNDEANLGLSVLLAADPETGAQLAAASMSTMASEAKAIVADLEELVEAHESDAAAARAAADRATNTTLWLLIGLSAAAFLVAAGTIAMLIVSVMRPLTALRASARAITSGDLEARATVSGPEEVASLAHDFNEMTDALSAKTQEYIDTTNLTGDIIVRIDKHGRWAFLNDAACQFYGKPREELLGTDSRPFLHPEDKERTSQMVRQARTGKDLVRGFVNRQITPLGIRVTEWNAYPLFDEQGHYAGMQATGRDITQRKRAEEALRESEKRYRDLFENANDLIQSVAPDGSFVYVNRAWREALGYGEDEIAGLSLFDIIHPDSKAYCTEMFQRVMAGEKLDRLEAMFVTKDGRTIWVEGSASCRFEDGKPVATRGIFRDITERKRAEEALRLQSEIMQNMAEAVYLIRASDGVIVYTNPAFERLFGYGPGEMVGKHVSVVNAPTDESSEETAKEIMATLDRTGVWRGEILNIKKDGTLFWSYANVSTFDHPGHGRVWVAYHTDITERKRAEEEREKALDDIGERMKELACIYRVTDLGRGGKAIEEFVQDVVIAIPPGWQYPEITRAKLSLDGREYVSEPFEETPWQQSSDIVIRGQKRGVVEVYYLEERPELDEGPFLREERNLIDGIARVLSDAVDRKQAEKALASSEERLRILFEFAPDAYYLNDLQGNFVDGNKAAEEVTGYKREELVGKNMLELKLLPPEQLAKAAAALARHAQGKPAGPNEFTLDRKDGSQVPVEIRAFPVKIKDQTLVLGIARDITERKQAQDERERLNAELEVRAITDCLTGLYNHAHFFQRLAEEIDRSNRYGRGFSILMMDVDNFKQFNDSRGHQAGDEALCLVADCIRTALRRSDIPFRYGGDEFAAMLLHADLPRAQAIAKRMNRCIARRLKEMNNPVAASLGLSTGVACFPQDATTVDDLVRIADTALYDAKRATQARRATQQGQAIDLLASPSGTLDENQQRVLSAAAGSLAAILQDVSLPDILADLDLRTIAAIGAAAEIKDPYIRKHQERVSRWAAALAEEMGLSPKQVQEITIAGLLHDLGKVSISEQILNKPGKLTQEEYAKIKEHAALGVMIVAHIESLQPLVPIVRHHHERFDGNGYPDGLAGEEIPLEARILSVVDVFDAMTHERSYRKALSKAEAVAELERGAGTQFDPAAVKAFLALLKKRSDGLACPVHAASEAGPLATAKAAGRSKG